MTQMNHNRIGSMEEPDARQIANHNSPPAVVIYLL